MSRKRPVKKASYQVFISHATADKWIAMQLEKMIQDLGIRTFRDDRDLEAGKKIPEELRGKVETSNELLVLWTPQAMGSEWVKMEVSLAFGFKLHIVALRYLTDPGNLHPAIKADLSPELTETEVNKYCKDLKARAQRFQGSVQ